MLPKAVTDLKKGLYSPLLDKIQVRKLYCIIFYIYLPNLHIIFYMHLKPHTKDYNKIRYFVCPVLSKSKYYSIFKYFYWLAWLSLFRSSHPVVFHRKCAFKHFTKFTGKHMCRNLFFKTAGLQRKKIQHGWVFLWIFQNLNECFYKRTPPDNFVWLFLMFIFYYLSY